MRILEAYFEEMWQIHYQDEHLETFKELEGIQILYVKTT